MHVTGHFKVHMWWLCARVELNSNLQGEERET